MGGLSFSEVALLKQFAFLWEKDWVVSLSRVWKEERLSTRLRYMCVSQIIGTYGCTGVYRGVPGLGIRVYAEKKSKLKPDYKA